MCGRFSLVTTKEKITNLFGEHILIPNSLELSYNIAPTQQSLVLTNDKPDKLQAFNWGLIPYWSKDTRNAGRLINARREGISTKPSFRLPIRKQRCLVIADSFYEWRKEGSAKKPFRILRKDGELLVFAGIWDTWKGSNKTIQSFSIITTKPNKDMDGIHDRMPLILTSSEQQGQWISDINPEEIDTLMQSPREGLLINHRVSTSVNSVKNNGAHLHDEIDDTLLTLF